MSTMADLERRFDGVIPKHLRDSVEAPRRNPHAIALGELAEEYSVALRGAENDTEREFYRKQIDSVLVELKQIREGAAP